jgi:uncharacterized membrane protein YbaN (DUF454 family)
LEVWLLSIFETIGIAYTVLATTLFTVEVIYCSAKGLNNLRHLLARGQGGEEKRRSQGTKSPLVKINS